MNDSWLVYLNLEREVIEAFNYVHFCDSSTQLNVYSRKFAELLIRISIEIETLSKEVYWQNGGTKKDKPYFDTDCIEYLEDIFKIKQKVVKISYPYFDCKNPNSRIIVPLNDFCLNDSSGWQKSYQSVKHDRLKCARKATLKNVVYSLAALYLVNIYYRNEKFVVHLHDIFSYDTRFGSLLFALEKPVSRNNILVNDGNDGAVYEIEMKPDSRSKSDALIKNYRERIEKFIKSQPESLEKDFWEMFGAQKHSTLIEYVINYINSLFEYRFNKEFDSLSSNDKVVLLKEKYSAKKLDGWQEINVANFDEMKKKYLKEVCAPIIQSFGPPNTSFELYEALYDLKIIKHNNSSKKTL